MPDSESIGLTILAAGLVGVVAVLSSRVSERLRIPAPVEAGLAAPGGPHWPLPAPQWFFCPGAAGSGRPERRAAGGASGASDPVGIALLVALLSATGSGLTEVGTVASVLALQMAVGAVTGVTGGRAVLLLMRRVPLPNGTLAGLR